MFYNLSRKDVIIMNQKTITEPINGPLKVQKQEIEKIQDLIYTIRQKQVMLDSDVARLYHYETKKINQTVKRNQERFPERFCFQLTEEELENMWSQNVTTSKLRDNKFRSKKYLPYVFTEQGIAMLSGLLKNEVAIQVSIHIMDAFVEMRKFITLNGQIFQEINLIKNKLLEHDKIASDQEEKFKRIFDELQRKKKEEFKQQIFFNGQIYDAYCLIMDIIKTAKRKILIIDNYVDDTILKMLTKKNKEVEVVILTSFHTHLTKLDIHQFNQQYPTLKVEKTNQFHDRFMLIDNKELYHLGASLKDLGKKCFAISRIEDKEYIRKINQNL